MTNMFNSSNIGVNRKWMQRGIFTAMLLVVFLLFVKLHTETNSSIKDVVGNTITKIKQMTSLGANFSSQYVPLFSPTTDMPAWGIRTGNKDVAKSSIATSLMTEADTFIISRFEERSAIKNNVCKKAAYKSMAIGQKLDNRFSPLGRGLIRWCRIPKVGSTYLQGLERRVIGEIGETVKSQHEGSSFSKRLILVREPYSRLVSGYIGKMVTNPPWSRTLGAKIIAKFRPTATTKALKCGHDMTFPEFLKYFILADDTGWKQNLHFVPMYRQCNPCAESYDYIGHLETLKDDLSFILKSVNITVNMDFSDEESTLKGKCKKIVDQKDKIVKCESMCAALQKTWWSFHARGLISTDVKFPLSGERCNTISGEEFADLAWDAHIQSTGRINKSKQRREALVNLYLQVPLLDRLKVRDHLMKDFELYGYDPQPADIFPELQTNKHKQKTIKRR